MTTAGSPQRGAGAGAVCTGSLLAVSTSGDRCSVALLMATAGRIECDAALEAPSRSASETVLGLITSLLAGRGLAHSALSALALDIGPGSFTGVRIGCAVVQGLAWGLDKRVVPVSSLEVMAAAAAGDGGRVAVAADARMGEVYHQVFDVDANGEPVALGAPEVGDPAAAIARFDAAATSGLRVAGDGYTAHPALAAWHAASVQAPLRVTRPDAGVIARLAWRRYAAGLAVGPVEAAPLYVRDRVAADVDEQRRMRASR